MPNDVVNTSNNTQFDTVQDNPACHDSTMDSDDGESRTFRTAQSVCSDDQPRQSNLPFNAFDDQTILPLQPTGLPRCLTHIDDLFGQLSMYNDVATLPPLPRNLDANVLHVGNLTDPDSIGLEIETSQVFSSMPDSDIQEIQTSQVLPDDTTAILDLQPSQVLSSLYGLINTRLSHLESTIGNINGSVNSLAGIMMSHIVPQPQPSAVTSTAPQSRPLVALSTGRQPTHLPKRRSAQSNDLARKVRASLETLLGSEMFEPGNLLSRDEIEAFAAMWRGNSTVHRCCDIGKFKLDFLGSPRSAWNQSACSIFIDYFVRINGLSFPRPAIRLAFYMRVRSLQHTYRTKLSPPSLVAEAKSAQKRLARMRALYRKRVCLAKKHSMLDHHVAMLDRIGILGMSSDESDSDETPTKYHVHIPRWRSPELSSWLHAIDQLDQYFRVADGKKRGALPRLRIHSTSGPISNKRFVRGLPRSAYNPNWLLTIINLTHDVMITDETYHFVHDNRLFSYFGNRN